MPQAAIDIGGQVHLAVRVSAPGSAYVKPSDMGADAEKRLSVRRGLSAGRKAELCIGVAAVKQQLKSLRVVIAACADPGEGE